MTRSDPSRIGRYAIVRLRHPNIVTVFDVGEHDGEPFIAMEYVEGRTLAQFIAGGEVSVSRALQLVDEVCAGFHYAHRAGIVHRDIKPANIMVDAAGTVRILDFGVARGVAVGTGLPGTQSGVIVGTLNYMSAPGQLNLEQLRPPLPGDEQPVALAVPRDAVQHVGAGAVL
jgi:serine/threonine protein kinase